ncbi:MAG: hypothetical protein GXX96_22695, partial [Planctomycetaceae bacterium]|nr:hypothetical protein [Planctomycetaceae bacterium]
MSTSRRRFLRSSALAAAGVSVAPLAAADKPATSAPPAPHSPDDDPRMRYYDQFYFKEKPVFRFEYPFDGGVLQEGTGYPILGTETGADGVKRLRIHVVVRPGDVGNLQVFDPEGAVIPMEHISGALMGTALLKDRLSILKARGKKNGKPVEFTCRVLWAKNAYKRYRCYIDDHSFCFRDILQKQYKSIFDCFYFAKLRELHKRYQTKIVLNCFNSTPERDFTLSMFPEKYKPEFEDNADWLRLAFHSENEFPGEPYRNATPEKLAADFDLTATQLKRIAGKAYT